MKEHPYFIPGYTGFCPQLKNHFGQTYGHATRHIIQRNPNLKERLAPIHYKCGKYERIRGASRLGKQPHQQRNKHDHLSHVLDENKVKYRPGFAVGNKGVEKHHLGHEGADKYRSQYYGDNKGVGPCTSNCSPTCTDGVIIRKTDYEYICPKHAFTNGVPDFVLLPIRIPEGRQKLQQEHHPYVAAPCIHEREYIEHYFPTKKHRSPRIHVHVEEYHPGDYNHGKDARFGTDHKVRKVRKVKPQRQGGVIPKYTGHIPGMMFSIGESYGPVSDRLLRKHHDRMKELKIKILQ